MAGQADGFEPKAALFGTGALSDCVNWGTPCGAAFRSGRPPHKMCDAVQGGSEGRSFRQGVAFR